MRQEKYRAEGGRERKKRSVSVVAIDIQRHKLLDDWPPAMLGC